MKGNYTQLYPNEEVAIKVGNYAYHHSTQIPQHMLDHHAWATENHERSNMMISPMQAQFQIWIAKALGVKREIGCFIGFSGMGWSNAVGYDGVVTTLEFSSAYAEVAKDTFMRNGIKNVEVVIGDARESLKTIASKLSEPYDLIFIDADKTSYPTYLTTILALSPSSLDGSRLLRPGGVIIADNILRRGLVADCSDANPWSDKLKQQGEAVWNDGDLKALDEFNKMMVIEARIDTFLMPMFDGLGMGILKD